MAKDMKLALLLDYYGNLLTDKQREVVDLYYNEDLSLAEISEHSEITRQGVRDSIKRGEAVLLEAEEKLGLVERFRREQQRKEEALAVLDELNQLNRKRYLSDEIKEKLMKMYEILTSEDEENA